MSRQIFLLLPEWNEIRIVAGIKASGTSNNIKAASAHGQWNKTLLLHFSGFFCQIQNQTGWASSNYWPSRRTAKKCLISFRSFGLWMPKWTKAVRDKFEQPIPLFFSHQCGVRIEPSWIKRSYPGCASQVSVLVRSHPHLYCSPLRLCARNVVRKKAVLLSIVLLVFQIYSFLSTYQKINNDVRHNFDSSLLVQIIGSLHMLVLCSISNNIVMRKLWCEHSVNELQDCTTVSWLILDHRLRRSMNTAELGVQLTARLQGSNLFLNHIFMSLGSRPCRSSTPFKQDQSILENTRNVLWQDVYYTAYRIWENSDETSSFWMMWLCREDLV